MTLFWVLTAATKRKSISRQAWNPIWKFWVLLDPGGYNHKHNIVENPVCQTCQFTVQYTCKTLNLACFQKKKKFYLIYHPTPVWGPKVPIFCCCNNADFSDANFSQVLRRRKRPRNMQTKNAFHWRGLKRVSAFILYDVQPVSLTRVQDVQRMIPSLPKIFSFRRANSV